jgi:transcriptional regulator GlxA family with amidase domain
MFDGGNDNDDINSAMRLCVLAFDDVFDTGLAAVLDTFETAAALGAGERGKPVQLTLASMRRRVRTHQGFTVPVAALPAARPDVVVVPALGCKTPETLTAALRRPDVADGCAQLAAWSRAGALVTAACTGTFVLGAAGLLDGCDATTTWWLAPCFREQFPRARLDETRMIVESGRVVTAGTALAHVDLALWLVRRRSPTLARAVARHLLYDARPSQAVYVMPDHLAHADPLVERFEAWARTNLAAFSIERAARACGASERTLERRVRAVLGTSPLSYVRDLRVERAVHRLQTTDESLDDIAAAVGYGDGVTLRALLRQKTGRGVKELRTLWDPA